MALHFYGNQFDEAYRPKVLRNWEVPKFYCDKPRHRTGYTKVLSNNRGHLLPGIPRPKTDPWGDFVGTWQLPKKIDRKTADRLNGIEQYKKFKCYKGDADVGKQKNLIRHDKNNEDKKKNIDASDDVNDDGNDDNNVTANDEDKYDDNVDNDSNTNQYVPGDLTEIHHRVPYPHISTENNPSPKGYPKYKDDYSKKSPEPEKNITDEEVKDMYKKHQELLNNTFTSGQQTPLVRDRPSSPLLEAISNFGLAKKLHKENLEHDPLPDTITDRMYLKLQMQRRNHDPALVLDEENYATGVGWKGYPGFGANKCTKLKVYRPKTGVQNKNKLNETRPTSSVSSFDKKWRFIRQRKVSPIELAICWDLTPENPLDEPKRTTHIDGSNGSLAPAVFSLVHTPKETTDGGSRKSSASSAKTLFECRPNPSPGDKDFILDNTIRPKTAPRLITSGDIINSTKQSIGDGSLKKRAKSAYHLNGNENLIIEKQSNNKNLNYYQRNKNNKVHQSTPNLDNSTTIINNNKYCSKDCLLKQKTKNSTTCPNTIRRLHCVACDLKNVSIKDNNINNKNEYKMAFKAGVPQKHVSTSTANYVSKKSIFKVPKQKDPYSPRSYVIRSLAPPFSLQNAKRQDYPEHWRLATVYQLSYKPIQARKRPLLATVFK